MRLLKCASIALLASAGTAAAQQQATEIDRQLAANLDFRDLRFSDCFGLSVCEVDRYRIIAWHRHSDQQPWHGAELYWDPVDGLGIQGAGQDDEIDFNERLIIEFPSQQDVYGVWLTDLFINELIHYAGSAGNEETAENAGIELRRVGVEPEKFSISGNIELPPQPFNSLLAPELFAEGGDLRQRLVIRDGTISVLSASVDANGERTVLTSVPVNQLDMDKDELFGDDGVTVDLSALFGTALEIPLEREGTRNADRISAILERQERLGQLQNSARVSRSVGDVPNGEVSGTWDTATPATSIMFHAPAGSSNDFSVAGILFNPVSQ